MKFLVGETRQPARISLPRIKLAFTAQKFASRAPVDLASGTFLW
jgi:hypothetical protein